MAITVVERIKEIKSTISEMKFMLTERSNAALISIVESLTFGSTSLKEQIKQAVMIDKVTYDILEIHVTNTNDLTITTMFYIHFVNGNTAIHKANLTSLNVTEELKKIFKVIKIPLAYFIKSNSNERLVDLFVKELKEKVHLLSIEDVHTSMLIVDFECKSIEMILYNKKNLSLGYAEFSLLQPNYDETKFTALFCTPLPLNTPKNNAIFDNFPSFITKESQLISLKLSIIYSSPHYKCIEYRIRIGKHRKYHPIFIREDRKENKLYVTSQYTNEVYPYNLRKLAAQPIEYENWLKGILKNYFSVHDFISS